MNIVAKKKKNSWWGVIETKEDAIAVISGSSKGFYLIAVLYCVLGYFVGSSIIFDGVLYAIFAYLLHKFKSRIAAICLLLLSLISLVSTLDNKFGSGTGGKNIILAACMIWISIRALQATFKLKKLNNKLV